MPLEVARLRDSDLVALSTGDELKAALLLWIAAWGQVPAASLPDDDRILARLTGYPLAQWRRLRAMALRGFSLCSDGRLYHPLIADLAMQAYAKRRGQAERANSRWARSKAKTPANSKDSAMPMQCGDDAAAVQGTDKGTDSDSLSDSGDLDGFEEAWTAYPHVRGRSSRPKALAAWKRLPRARRAALPAAVARYAREGREPKAQCGAPGMDRWLRDERFLDWLEAAPDAAAPAGPAFPGPAAVREAVAAAQGEAWTRSWLDPCGWRDGAITTPNAFAADTLRRDLASVLDALGVGVTVQPP